MLVFVLFAIINLAAGFACAVALGFGPRPWYALFLPSGGNNLVHIEVLEPETAAPESEDKVAEEAPEVENSEEDEELEEEAEAAPPSPPKASESFPDLNKPADKPQPMEVEQAITKSVEEEPVADEPTSPVASLDLDEEEHELEDYLAGRTDDEPEEKLPTDEPEPASPEDIEAMFATDTKSAGSSPSKASAESDDAEEDESPEDRALSQDDIASLFQ